MYFSSTIALLFCLTIYQSHAAVTCPGATSKMSDEDFKWKYEAASIVAYGSVLEVTNNVAKFMVFCNLKSHLPLPEVNLTLPNSAEITNTSQCHYLTALKNYTVFLDVIKTTSEQPKITYALANMEEIEIKTSGLSDFLKEECEDTEDENTTMNMFFYDNSRQCGSLTVVCNETNKEALLSKTYPLLSKTAILVGGFRNPVPAPAGSITGKTSAGVDDQTLRSAATLNQIYMPVIATLMSFVFLSKA